MPNQTDLPYLNALNKIPGVGAQKMRKLLSFFPDPESAWTAGLGDLIQSGLGEALAEKFVSERGNIDPAREWAKLEKEKIEMIVFEDATYPQLLKEVANPPYLIYKRGDFDLNSAPMISIVGSRKYTAYGSQSALAFARDLARAGVIVVSGMAIGIDSLAHRGALDAEGKTVAVLGGSLDDKNIYPRINYNLSREIMENGALLSDYPVETPAGLPGNFPARNRLIAGLSLGTLIVEAGENSGTLITAGLALEYNREVFAVPGSIFSPQSEGAHHLIKQGAKLVTSVKDILDELSLEKISQNQAEKKIIPASKEEEILIRILSAEPLHIDNIAKLSKLGTVSAASTLAMLEIKGMVKNIGGQNYILL